MLKYKKIFYDLHTKMDWKNPSMHHDERACYLYNMQRVEKINLFKKKL